MKRWPLPLSWLLLVFATSGLLAQSSPPKAGADQPALNIPWPDDFKVDEDNYARELLFNPNIGDEYLRQAQEFYNKGYDLMNKYQGVPDNPDPFIRDPYKVYVSEVWNTVFRQDYSNGYVYFYKAYRLYTTKLQWDDNAKGKPGYKELLSKILKGMIFTSLYAKNFFVCNDYLDSYLNMNPEDKVFGYRWKLKVLGLIIAKQQQYNVGFSGNMNANYWRNQYIDILQKYLATQNFSARTRAYIEDQVLPQFSMKEFNTQTIDTNVK
jgi:hypothetical protein